MDTKPRWCGDALCGMAVIRSPSRLISNGFGEGAAGVSVWVGGGNAGPCFSAKNNDSDGTELVEAGMASQVKRLWRRAGMKRGRTGTLDPRGEECEDLATLERSS